MAIDPREQAAKHGTLGELCDVYSSGDARAFRNFLGETLLELGAINPSLADAIEIVGFLLDEGSDVHVIRDDGLNVLHRIFSRHDNAAEMVPTVRRLVDLGADYNGVAKRIGTPLDVLFRMTANRDEREIMPIYDYFLTLDGLDLRKKSLGGKSFYDRVQINSEYCPLLLSAIDARLGGRVDDH